MTKKYCKDCAYCSMELTDPNEWRCNHSSAILDGNLDLVTGELPSLSAFLSCYEARKLDGVCGIEGKNYLDRDSDRKPVIRLNSRKSFWKNWFKKIS